MWVFTQHGFISAVQHFDDATKIVVRSRDKQTLEVIADLYELEILSTPGNDYPYRVHATREQFSNYLLTEVDLLDYTNYKNRLHDSRGDRYYGAASKVWSAMHDVEDWSARAVGA